MGGNHIVLLRDGEQAYPEMLAAISRARQSVWLQMYWFATDEVGQRFLAALSAAARRGVDVRLLYDAFGSLGSDSQHFEQLEQEGARVVEFNPLKVWHRRFRLSRLTRRNHRKLLLVDQQIAFTGGLNIADQWLPIGDAGGGWRDDAVRVEGPVVAELETCFLSCWNEASDGLLRRQLPLPHRVGEAHVAVLAQARFRGRRQALAAYVRRLRQARRRVFIANAYFVPSPRLLRALMAATRRGVDVRIIVPGESDVIAVRHASRAVWARLLRVGARIFEWQPSILHSKTALIDDWATVGSFNLDYLSVRQNLELNVSVLDGQFARSVEESFLEDLGQCREVDRRTLMFRSLGDRVLERVTYWFRAWL